MGGVRMKLLKILYNTVFVLFCFCNVAYASGVDMSAIETPLTEITQVLLVIAGGACVAKIIHIGILYVTSSAADKSNAKMALLPWIVGTFLCFGAATIGPAIINILRVDKDVLSY